MRFYARRIMLAGNGTPADGGALVEPVRVSLDWRGGQWGQTQEVLHIERGTPQMRSYNSGAKVEGPHWLEVGIYPAGPEGASEEMNAEYEAARELAREMYQENRGDIPSLLVNLCKELMRSERVRLELADELARSDNRHSVNEGDK